MEITAVKLRMNAEFLMSDGSYKSIKNADIDIGLMGEENDSKCIAVASETYIIKARHTEGLPTVMVA